MLGIDHEPQRAAAEIFEAVAVGEEHTCGLTDDGRLLCWGLNNAGQVGDGAQLTRAAPERVPWEMAEE